MWLKATRGFHVSLRDLPPFLVQILAREARYKRQDIEVVPAKSVEIGIPAFEGNRSYAIAVNLGTKQHKSVLGDWSGGAGSSPVDRGGSFNIPSNAAVISGEYGGRGSFGRIYINPDNVAALIEQDDGVELSEDEKYAIVFINMFNSRGRKDAFESKGLGEYSSSNPLVRSLVSKGLLKLQGAGVKVTTQGKNVRKSLDRKYENTW